MATKDIIKFASVTTTGTSASAAQTLSSSGVGNKWQTTKLQQTNEAMVFNVKTLNTGSLIFTVQEWFSDAWVTVGSATVTATGTTSVSSESQTGTQIALGKGTDNQILVTTSGSPTSVSYDVYCSLYGS